MAYDKLTNHRPAILKRIIKYFLLARRPSQPAWLRDARDEDLLKVGLTRAALQAAIVPRHATHQG